MLVPIQEDEDGDLVLPLPFELCEQLGWKIGDAVKWIDNGDGSFTITKVVAK